MVDTEIAMLGVLLLYLPALYWVWMDNLSRFNAQADLIDKIIVRLEVKEIKRYDDGGKTHMLGGMDVFGHGVCHPDCWCKIDDEDPSADIAVSVEDFPPINQQTLADFQDEEE